MKTSSAKAKGRRLQQALAAAILEAFQELTPADVRSTQMGGSGIDVQLSAAARRLFPFAFEAKNRETINMWESIKQAEVNAKVENLIPAVAILRNRLPQPWVAIPLDTFMRLIKNDAAWRQFDASL